MTVDSYLRWTKSAFRTSPTPFQDFLHALPDLPIPLRKVALSFFRTQVDRLVPGVRFFDRNRTKLLKHVSNTPGNTTRLVDYLVPLCSLHDPLFSGICAAFTLSAPYNDYSSADSALHDSVATEVSAGEEYNIRDIDYSSWFGPDKYRGVPLCDGVESNHRVANVIHRSFSDARATLSGRLIMPKVGVKTVGEAARRIMESMRLDLLHLDPYTAQTLETVADVERLHCLYGIDVEGPTELRCSWKYNTLKPRTYFAQGPTVYHKAKYIQPIMNELVDLFPVTHRRMRFNLPFGRMLSDHSTFMAIYDYSAFTSRMTESTRFIEAMARFFKGVVISVLDTRDGIVEVDIGEMFDEYLLYAQHHQYVDLGRFETEGGFYHRAGLLGIPGNISSCTLLHGLFLATIVGDLVNCKCVGDDAIVLLRIPPDERERFLVFIGQVKLLGEVAEEKFESWGHPHDNHPYNNLWNYCKRPITRAPDHIIRGDLSIVPSVELCLGLSDTHHVANPSMASTFSRFSRIQTQMIRLLTKLYLSKVVVSPCSCQILCDYFNYTMHTIMLSSDMAYVRTGGVCDSGVFSSTLGGKRFGLRSLRSDTVGGPVDEILYGDRAVVPLYLPVATDTDVVPTSGTALVKDHQGLALLERLGFVSTEKAAREVEFRLSSPWENAEFRVTLDQLLRGELSPTYRVTVLRDLPSWYSELVHLRSTSEKRLVQDHFTDGPTSEIPSDEEYWSDDVLIKVEDEDQEEVPWVPGVERAMYF